MPRNTMTPRKKLRRSRRLRDALRQACWTIDQSTDVKDWTAHHDPTIRCSLEPIWAAAKATTDEVCIITCYDWAITRWEFYDAYVSKPQSAVSELRKLARKLYSQTAGVQAGRVFRDDYVQQLRHAARECAEAYVAFENLSLVQAARGRDPALQQKRTRPRHPGVRFVLEQIVRRKLLGFAVSSYRADDVLHRHRRHKPRVVTSAGRR